MKTTREHIWYAMAQLPNAASATAYILWQNMPTFQEASIRMANCFHNNPWSFLTMPHEDFVAELAVMGYQHYNSPFHPSYFP